MRVLRVYPPNLVEGDYSNGPVRPYVRNYASLTQFCLCSSSHSFQGILMKLFSYCFHDLKLIIFTEFMHDQFLTELWPFVNCSIVSLVFFNSSCSFHWILIKSQFIVPMIRRGSYYIEVMLNCLLTELSPFVSFSHLNIRNSCHRNPSFIYQGIFIKLPGYSCHHVTWLKNYWDYDWTRFARNTAFCKSVKILRPQLLLNFFNRCSFNFQIIVVTT